MTLGQQIYLSIFALQHIRGTIYSRCPGWGMLHVNHLAQTVKLMIEHLTPDTVFKCLSDETRARMTLLIASEGELCVCELTTALEESQPKISRHLSQLRSCAILEDRRQGQWVYYRLHPHLPDWVHDVLQVILNANKRWLSPDAERLERMRDRPGRTTVCS